MTGAIFHLGFEFTVRWRQRPCQATGGGSLTSFAVTSISLETNHKQILVAGVLLQLVYFGV